MGELIAFLILAFFAYGIFLYVIDIFQAIIGKATNLKNKVAGRPTQDSFNVPSSEHEFSISVKKSSERLDGKLSKTLNIYMSGVIECPRENTSVKYVVTLLDTTDSNDPRPIISHVEQLQEPGNITFHFETPEQQLPYASNVFQEEVQLLAVPEILVLLPFRGQRKLKISVDVVGCRNPPEYSCGFRLEGHNSELYASSSLTIDYLESMVGYEEISENREETERLTVQLALLVAAADGKLDAKEGQVIQSWARKKVDSFRDESQRSDAKERLNSNIRSSIAELKSKKLDFKKVAGSLLEISDVGERYDALELCMHVARVDGEIHPREYKLIKDIAIQLELDMDRFNELSKKLMPANLHVGKSDPESLLGIEAGMTKEEIRKILREQYKKWSMLEGHSNSDKRKNAKDMIDLIAKLRKKYS